MEKTQQPGKAASLFGAIGHMLKAGAEVFKARAAARAMQELRQVQRPNTPHGFGRQHQMQVAAGRVKPTMPEVPTRQIKRAQERAKIKALFRDQKDAKLSRQAARRALAQ